MRLLAEYLSTKVKIDKDLVCLVITEQNGWNGTVKYEVYDNLKKAKENVKECVDVFITTKNNIETIVKTFEEMLKTNDYSKWNKMVDSNIVIKHYSPEKFFKIKT